MPSTTAFFIGNLFTVAVVLFDIDGTLIATGGAGAKAFNQTFLEEFGFDIRAQKISFAGRTDTGLVRDILSSNGVEPSETNFRRFFDIYPRLLAQQLVTCRGAILPGVEKLLNDLEQLDPKPTVGLLTGNIRKGAELKLTHYKLWHRFSIGAFADDHHERNQIACIAHNRCRDLLSREVRGDEVVVIGDTPLDIECGKAIGAKTLAVATGMSSIEELETHHPTWTVADLTQITAHQIAT